MDLGAPQKGLLQDLGLQQPHGLPPAAHIPILLDGVGHILVPPAVVNQWRVPATQHAATSRHQHEMQHVGFEELLEKAFWTHAGNILGSCMACCLPLVAFEDAASKLISPICGPALNCELHDQDGAPRAADRPVRTFMACASAHFTAGL